MKKLIKMTDFVKKQKQSTSFKEKQFIDTELLTLERIRNYANFLSQTPQLYMFVPCDSEGNVLEEPTEWTKEEMAGNVDSWETHEYQQAKERCYFEGFEVDYSNNEPDNKWIRLKCGKLFITFYENLITVNYPFQDSIHITTLEQLTDYNLPLTATAQKEIGL